MLDPQQSRCFPNLPADFVARDPLAFQRKADVVGDVHMRIEGKELEDEGDIALRRPAEGDILAIEQDASLAGQLKAGDHAQRGRLPAARRAQHHEEGAVLDREIRAVDGDEILEGLAQLLDANLSHVHAYFGKWLNTTKPRVPAKIVTKE